MADEHSTTQSANRQAAQQLVDACLSFGINHFFLAPGSRCTPLTLAIANHPDAHITQHVDERGLAYACLGYGRATGQAGVFVCTSGTAAAGALPAVVEASLDHVPMLLLTADRPPELRDTGANQAIDQVHLFGRYTRWFFDLPCPDDVTISSLWSSSIRHAHDRSQEGPVHLNCMFREPFGANDQGRRSAGVESSRRPLIEAEHSCRWQVPSGRTLVIAGGCRPHEALAAEQLAEQIGCPFLADVTSGRQGLSFDLVLMRGEVAPADVVIHVGGRVVSKRWLQFVDAHPPTHYLHLTPFRDRLDPLHRVTQVLHGPIAAMCRGAETSRQSPAEFLSEWTHLSRRSRDAAQAAIRSKTTITEPGVALTVSREIPDGHGLVLGNSMPIRDMDMYRDWDPRASRQVAANRGASGIDGLVATAAGFAVGINRPTTAIVGDLAVLHDLNALALLPAIPVPVILIVINNDGGGIFHFLPAAHETDRFEQFFATPHGRSFEHAAKMFSLTYANPTSIEDFESVYRQAAQSSDSSVIEVRTDREQNRNFHGHIELAIQEASR